MSGLFDFTNGLTKQVKKLFKPSDVRIGNFVFSLHQQWTFVIIIVGLIFATSNNYLNKQAMVCYGKDESSYVNNFCFLHGNSHVSSDLQKEISSSTSCISEDEGGEGQDKIRTTRYYIWIPFVLAFIAIMIKLPGILWKNILEKDMMQKLVEDMNEDGSLTAHRFHKVVLGKRSSSRQAMIYNFGFAFCEVLNLAVVLISMSVLNSVLNNEFSNYGVDVQNFNNFDPKTSKTPDSVPVNRMCHLFPTEVSCTVKYGGIGGNPNKENILCLLPNNVFYQYYFLILWWWWVVLSIITGLALVYRLVQILVPQVGRIRLGAMFNSMGVEPEALDKVAKMKLKTWQTFLLIRLVSNLKGSQVTKLFETVDRKGQIQERKEESQALLEQEESTEMTSVVAKTE